MIYVIATIEIATGRRDDFLNELTKIVPLVRQERGCLEYIPTIDLETTIAAQPDVREHVVTIVEKWESLATLEAHLVARHMVEYRKTVKQLVTQVTLQILQPG